MSNSPLHRKQDAEDGIHVIQRYLFDNATDRAAFTNEQSGNAYNLLPLTADDIGAVARQTDNNSFWVLTNYSPVTWIEMSNTGIVAYSTVQDDGSALAQQPILNFRYGFTLANDAGNTRTIVDLEYAAPSVTVKSENTAASAGSATTVLRSDAQIQVATASPSTTVKSEATAASQGSSDSLLRADAQLQVATASPSTTIKSEATAASQGSSSSLLRADAQLQAATAAPSTTVKSEATAAGQGTSSSLLRADAQLQVATAAPSTTIKSEATAAGQGTSSSLLRADAQLQAATAAPSTNVLSDASSAQQGTSSSLLRADARLIATTATPVAVGGANAQGSSTSLARADHVHSAPFPLLVFGAETVTPTTVTRYLVPGYGGGTDIPINPVRVYMPRACVLQRMYVAHSQTAGNGNSIVYTLRVNGVASALTVSLASTSNSGSNTSTTVSIAAGDYIDIEVTKASSIATSPAAITVTLEMAPA